MQEERWLESSVDEGGSFLVEVCFLEGFSNPEANLSSLDLESCLPYWELKTRRRVSRI